MRQSKPTLLVIDPDPANRAAAERAWKRGFRVISVEDAGSGFAAMRVAPPAVVFTEWDLPDVDGTSFERIVRANTELCTVPIVFSIGWTSRERIVQQIVGTGLIDHLDDASFSALVRGVTALTRGTPRSRSARGGSASDPSSDDSRDPDDGRAYLAKRLIIA